MDALRSWFAGAALMRLLGLACRAVAALAQTQAARLVAVGWASCRRALRWFDARWAWCRPRADDDGRWNPARHGWKPGESDDESAGPELRVRTGDSDDPGQAGLFMLSTQQRMLGMGNGQLSGVRPGGPGSQRTQDLQARREPISTAAHTRNSNIPGGQAARYFNRGGPRYRVRASRRGSEFQAAVALFPADDTITGIRWFSI